METTCPGPVPNPRKPLISLPENSCDSHCHILGPVGKFPYAPERERTFTPPEAPLEALETLWQFLGFKRAVIVQSVTHGEDHAVAIDALRRGMGRFRGVALVRPRTPVAEVARLHDAGFRGTRLHFMPGVAPVPSPDDIAAIIAKVRDYNWHLALHVAGDGVAEYEDFLGSLPGQVVIDHMARINLHDGLNSPAVEALKRLLDRGNIWVKLSGADRIATAPPSMVDAIALARLLAEHAPERVVWGTDYPHANTHGFVPDDGNLVDALELIAPTEAARRRLLVDNPTVCFDFAA